MIEPFKKIDLKKTIWRLLIPQEPTPLSDGPIPIPEKELKDLMEFVHSTVNSAAEFRSR